MQTFLGDSRIYGSQNDYVTLFLDSVQNVKPPILFYVNYAMISVTFLDFNAKDDE